MSRIVALSRSDPIAISGNDEGIWVADHQARAIDRYEPDSGALLDTIEVSSPPLVVKAWQTGLVLGLQDGTILFLAAGSRVPEVRSTAGGADYTVHIAGERIYVQDHLSGALTAIEPDSGRINITTDGVCRCVANDDGAYWLNERGAICHAPVSGRERYGQARVDPRAAGAIAVCANSLWISVAGGLQMVSLRTLEPGNRVAAPEGPVERLICEQGRLAGGGQGVFILDPAVDADARVVECTLESEVQDLAASCGYLWVLEARTTRAHIVSFD